MTILVGALPDMILPTSDCRTVLIALEAEAFARDGELVDPEGGVGMLKFQSSNITTSSYSYKRLNFHHFNDRYDRVLTESIYCCLNIRIKTDYQENLGTTLYFKSLSDHLSQNKYEYNQKKILSAFFFVLDGTSCQNLV